MLFRSGVLTGLCLVIFSGCVRDTSASEHAAPPLGAAAGKTQQAIFSPVQTSPQSYSGLFRHAQSGVSTQSARNIPDSVFFANPNGTIVKMKAQGYYLTSIDIRVVNGTRYYNAVFQAGVSPTQLWDLVWNDFQAKVSALDAAGMRLINVKSYVFNNTRWYTGIFQQGAALQKFSGAMDHLTFSAQNSVNARSGFYLANVDVFMTGGTEQYLGVWRAQGSDPAFWVGDWNGFAREYFDQVAMGRRLVDMRTWDTGTAGVGNRRYVGVWLAGTDSYDVVGATTSDIFTAKLAAEADLGNAPIRINFENGYMPPPGLAATFHDSIDPGAMGYSYMISEANHATAIGGFGYARAPWEIQNPGVPMSSSTRLDIASTTKAVAAAAALHLLENPTIASMGINLKTKLLTAIKAGTCGTCPSGQACIAPGTLANGQNPSGLPAKCIPVGPYVENITLADVLEMKSGLAASLATSHDCGSTYPTWLWEVITTGAHVAPGTTFEYDGVDWCIVRQLISQLTGQTFEDYLDTELFQPLGITSSLPNCQPDLSTSTRPLYYSANQKSGPGDESFSLAPLEASCGGGALQLTISQLGAFVNGLTQNTLLTAADFDTMQSQAMGIFPTPSFLGISYVKNGGTTEATGIGGASSSLAILPNNTQISMEMNAFDGFTLDPQMTTLVGFTRMYSYPTGKYVTLQNAGNNTCASIQLNSPSDYIPQSCASNNTCTSSQCSNDVCQCDARLPNQCPSGYSCISNVCRTPTLVVPDACLAPSGPHQQFVRRNTGNKPNNGSFMLEALSSGRCLTVEYASTSPGTDMIQFECLGQNNQTFTFQPTGGGYGSLINDRSGLCVTSEPTRLTQQVCDSSKPYQKWTLAAPKGTVVYASGMAYQVRAASSSLCASIQGNSSQDNASFVQYTCLSPVVPNQQFIWQDVGEGHFILKALNSGKCLTVENASTADNAKLIQTECLREGHQTFALQSTNDDYINIVNDKSRKCVTVAGNSMGNDAALIQYHCVPGAPNQKFTLK